MKFLKFVVGFLLVTGAWSIQAKADPKVLGFFWSKPADFTPYVDDGRSSHPAQWDHETWKLGDWVPDQRAGLKLIQRYYDVSVLKDQFVRNGVPVLEVGSGFYHLSGRDQRRVLSLVDGVYQITDSQPGIFYVCDWKSDKIVGVYSKAGFANE